MTASTRLFASATPSTGSGGPSAMTELNPPDAESRANGERELACARDGG
jgi:hypothetical protein